MTNKFKKCVFKNQSNYGKKHANQIHTSHVMCKIHIKKCNEVVYQFLYLCIRFFGPILLLKMQTEICENSLVASYYNSDCN